MNAERIQLVEHATLAGEGLRVSAPDGSMVRFTVSVAIAEATRDAASIELLQRADDALYEAKRRGRNRSVVAHALDVADPPTRVAR